MENDRWIDRFQNWVKHEPVRAAESVRALLLTLTVLSPFAGVENEITALAAAITALFSIYASQRVRNKVSPVASIEEERVYEEMEEDVAGV